MVFIGHSQQILLVESAKRHLGSSGETVFRDIIRETLDVPLEQVTYPQVPKLFKAIETHAPERIGRYIAFSLAEALRKLSQDAETGFTGRLIGSVGKRMGPSAEPFLRNVCNRLGVSLDEIDRGTLAVLADAVQQDSVILLGDEGAAGLRQAVLEAANAAPVGLFKEIIAQAHEQIGEDGEEIVRQLCRERLEVDLRELGIDGIGLLAGVMERDGPARIGAVRVAAFLHSARTCLTSPADPLRAKILDIAKRTLGPLGPDMVRDVCEREGLPFQVVDYEHLMWLAEVLRAEVASLVGKKDADALASNIRGLLTGAR